MTPPNRYLSCGARDRKSTRLNSSHDQISYAVFCLKKKNHPVLLAHTASVRPIITTLRRCRCRRSSSRAMPLLSNRLPSGRSASIPVTLCRSSSRPRPHRRVMLFSAASRLMSMLQLTPPSPALAVMCILILAAHDRTPAATNSCTPFSVQALSSNLSATSKQPPSPHQPPSDPVCSLLL